MMREDFEIRKIYNAQGPNALTAGERDRIARQDQEEFQALASGGFALGKLLGPIFGVILLISVLPFLITWAMALFGLVTWAFLFVHFFRAGPALFAFLGSVVMLAGLGNVPVINLWFYEFTPIETGVVVVDGPLSWIIGFLVVSAVVIPLGIVWLHKRWSLQRASDWHYLAIQRWRPGTPVGRWLALPLIALPLLAFLPLVIWLGLFGQQGVAPDMISQGEAVNLVLIQPLAVLSAGLGSDLLWPELFWAKALRLVLFLTIAPAMVFAAMDWRHRYLIVARTHRLKRFDATDDHLQELIRSWARHSMLQHVAAAERSMKMSYPDLRFPYVTTEVAGEPAWLPKYENEKSSRKRDIARLKAHGKRGPFPSESRDALREKYCL
ncbi:hypothetical protein KUV73_09535 [Mameliella alba]|nr:hypothetical protein [Mameliella alba]MBY6169585.1 hypothetical protein [Mameliella alba]MBY6174604.1 hypothetical protein [Mameliella alba]